MYHVKEVITVKGSNSIMGLANMFHRIAYIYITRKTRILCDAIWSEVTENRLFCIALLFFFSFWVTYNRVTSWNSTMLLVYWAYIYSGKIDKTSIPECWHTETSCIANRNFIFKLFIFLIRNTLKINKLLICVIGIFFK